MNVEIIDDYRYVELAKNTYLFKGQPENCNKISSGWVTDNYKTAMQYSTNICCYVTTKITKLFLSLFFSKIIISLLMMKMRLNYKRQRAQNMLELR